jgi:hypothetical protein
MDTEILKQALINAHKAGDTAAAKQLATALKASQMTPNTAVQGETPNTLKRVGTIADPLAQGLTFGFADELTAGLNAGINTVANQFGAGTGDDFMTAYTQMRDIGRERNEGYTKENPKTAMAAEIAGGLLTGGASAAKTGVLKAGNKLKDIVKVGGTQGAVYGAGTSEADDLKGLLQDSAGGAVLGAGTAAVAPAAVKSLSGLLTSAGGGVKSASDKLYQKAVNTLQNAGVKMTTGQQTGGKNIKTLETTLDGSLFGGAISDTFDMQRNQVQQKLLKLAGFTDDDAAAGVLTPESLERAAKRFSQRYDKALDNKKISLASDEFIDNLADVEAKHAELITVEQRKALNTIVNDFIDKAIKGPISGKEYQRLRSLMGKRQRQNTGSNNTTADLYGDLKNALDDAFIKASGDTKQLNKEYAQYLQLDKLFTNNAAAKADRLPFATLANLAEKSPGSKEWKDLTRAAYTVFSDATPNSGTATRRLNDLNLLNLATAPLTYGASKVLSGGKGADVLNTVQKGASVGVNALKPLDELTSRLGLLAAPASLPVLSQ